MKASAGHEELLAVGAQGVAAAQVEHVHFVGESVERIDIVAQVFALGGEEVAEVGGKGVAAFGNAIGEARGKVGDAVHAVGVGRRDAHFVGDAHEVADAANAAALAQSAEDVHARFKLLAGAHKGLQAAAECAVLLEHDGAPARLRQ